MYDIAIIGLGPAGATLTRLLDPKFNSIAIDKKSDETERSFRKPCGGLLAPDAQKALSKFNLTLPKDVLVDPQIFAVKTVDTGQKLMRYYRRFYMNLDRHKFDMWLMSLIPDHVTLCTDASCKSIRKVGECYEITYIQNKTEEGQSTGIRHTPRGAEQTVTAKYVIGADGSHSMVRRTLFPKQKIRQYTSIQQWFEEKHVTPFYSCIFDNDITDSYCWSISKDGYFILGGAFPKKESRKRFEVLKEKLQQDGFTFGAAVKTEACQVSIPRGLRDFCAARGDVFLIGEAAGFISPSSLEGISYALNSAHALAVILNSCHKNPAWKYRVKSIPMRMKLLLKYWKAPFMYNRFLRKVVMKLGINSIEVMEE
ncbi:MAG: FAD-binding protein [Peptococcaceae bacterium]|nr:FAD-binding protein [Peptococcaceae bacterium]